MPRLPRTRKLIHERSETEGSQVDRPTNTQTSKWTESELNGAGLKERAMEEWFPSSEVKKQGSERHKRRVAENKLYSRNSDLTINPVSADEMSACPQGTAASEMPCHRRSLAH